MQVFGEYYFVCLYIQTESVNASASPMSFVTQRFPNNSHV